MNFGSTDDSFIQARQSEHPIKIIEKPENMSYNRRENKSSFEVYL
jgi:hypothetical protein